jgi:integrase
VRRILAATANPKHHVMLATTYAAGLRVNELVHLRVMDIDSARMTIRVEQGKGAKDRYTLLSVRLLDELRTYWHQDRPRTWLFAARGADRPLDPSGIQRAYTAAKRRAGITKPGGIHGLRHSSGRRIIPSSAGWTQEFPGGSRTRGDLAGGIIRARSGTPRRDRRVDIARCGSLSPSSWPGLAL